MKKRFSDKLAADYNRNEPHARSVLRNTFKMLAILVITILLTEFMYLFDFGKQNLIMIYLLSVLVISCVTPTYVYGILSALISTFIYDFMITEPRLGFSFFSGLPLTLFTMLAATILTSTLTMQLKNQALLAIEREKHAELLYEMNQELLAARNVDAIVAIAGNSLVSHLSRPAVLYTKDPNAQKEGGANPVSGADDTFGPEVRKRVHRIFTFGAGETVEPFDDEHNFLYEPVISKEKVLGVIVIRQGGEPLGRASMTFLQMLAGQVALALELQYMSDARSHTSIEAEKEKMRSTLLRSISHDLRTPLTSILGASSTILEQQDLDGITRGNLVRDIKDNTEWLIRMVENILTITRISRDMKVTKTPEAAEEVVAQAVSIVRGRFPDCYIHIHIPEEVLIVPMDVTLISQVLINLLENAVKNSPEGSLIILDLERKGEFARFDISDNGAGIPDYLLENLFEPTAPAIPCQERAVDTSRGLGIGLSICQTIVHAHGGTIEAQNRQKGGASFSFRLPLRED